MKLEVHDKDVSYSIELEHKHFEYDDVLLQIFDTCVLIQSASTSFIKKRTNN
jgi:hypothetical protein